MNIKNKIIKKVLIVVFIPLAIFLLLVIYTAGKNIWAGYKWQKVADNFQESLEKPYKEDTYGGKTPEETWKMFLNALRVGDIELAIKYYEVGRIEGVPIDKLYTKKQNGQLQKWINELETLQKDEEQSISEERVYYFYNYFNEKYGQTLSSPVVFYFNPYTKVWKIVSL